MSDKVSLVTAVPCILLTSFDSSHVHQTTATVSRCITEIGSVIEVRRLFM
jgi:hypothetical protein